MLSLVSLAAAQFAYAQETIASEPEAVAAESADAPASQEVAAAAAPAAAAGSDGLEEVVVTGTRIVRDGYSAPTPVTVLGVEQLQSFASPNIADAINTMPELAGSDTPATSTTTASSGASNINALNLRALGVNRTLVLIDGRRPVASAMSGLVDINLIPQDLIKSVEVVTGGASAAYGSDALSGVVNFVLDKDFTGTKLTVQGGETTYGDGGNWMGGLTFGTAFGEGRGHLLFNANYRNQDIIPINDRDWNLKGWQFMNNPNYTVNKQLTGQPQWLRLSEVGPSNGFAGGVITDTSFRGTAFGPGGSPYRIQFGDLVSNPDMHGGDWELTQVRGTRAGQGLLGGSRTMSFFSRGSWDLTDDINVFAQASYARDRNHNYAFSLEDTGSISLSVDNAFLPENIRSAMMAQGVSTFHMGSMHTDLPIVNAKNDREVTSLLAGAQGKFGDGWSWDTYYQHDISEFESVSQGMYYNPYLDNAYDSVIDPDTGAAVCRSTLTDPTNGCKPYNPFGIGVNTQGAIDYVTGNGTTMWRKQQMTQDIAAFTVNGTPFATWAGDVSIATGVEWRMEAIGKGRNDELSPTQKWWVGGYQVSKGSYNVKEAFLETVVPLAKDLPALKSLDLSGAFRETDYSTSGSVQTWKLGLNWTPVDDIRFRTTLSRDIRAPNLEELFSNGGGGAPSISNPYITDEAGIPIQEYITSPRIGNPDLKPEKADSFGGGVVLTPRFLPGFALSVDYWKIDIDDAIGLPATQDIINGCHEGQTSFCSAIDFDDDGSQHIAVVRRNPFNYTTLKARGIDYEASYHFRPSSIIAAIPGTVQIRALATNYQKMASTINGVVDDTAGQNTNDGPPSWKWNASVNYTVEAFRGSVMARGVSAGVYDNDWIVCSTNCPAATSKYRTVNDNHIPSTVVWDASMTYMLPFDTAEVETFVNVRNVFDRDPPIVAPNAGGYSYTFSSTNAALYDQLGRTFTVGLRAKF